MATKTPPKATASRYLELLAENPPRPIRNDADHRRTVEALDRLIDRGAERTADEEDLMEVLGLLVETYENSIYEHPDVSGPDMLRHLIEEHGLTLTRLSEETGIPITSVSDILHRRRGISPKVRAKLCERFGVGPVVFI